MIVINQNIGGDYTKKILLIDDNDTYTQLLQKYLQRRGYSVDTASTLKEARTIIKKEMPLLFYCNLGLPDGSGLDLLHTMRQIAEMFQMKNSSPHFLPFFILTEGNDITMEYEYRHEGVNDYITAPVNIPELIRRVLFFVE